MTDLVCKERCLVSLAVAPKLLQVWCPPGPVSSLLLLAKLRNGTESLAVAFNPKRQILWVDKWKHCTNCGYTSLLGGCLVCACMCVCVCVGARARVCVCVLCMCYSVLSSVPCCFQVVWQVETWKTTCWYVLSPTVLSLYLDSRMLDHVIKVIWNVHLKNGILNGMDEGCWGEMSQFKMVSRWWGCLAL